MVISYAEVHTVQNSNEWDWTILGPLLNDLDTQLKEVFETYMKSSDAIINLREKGFIVTPKIAIGLAITYIGDLPSIQDTISSVGFNEEDQRILKEMNISIDQEPPPKK